MTLAVRQRPLFPALLVLSACVPLLQADDLLQPPQPPAPGSVGALFAPSASVGDTPAAPIPSTPAKVAPEPRRTTRLESTGGVAGSNLLETMKPGDNERRKLKNTAERDWGFVNSEFVWRAPERGYDTPFERGEWSTEDLVAVPMVGPFYVFGCVEMGGDYAADQNVRMIGRTGVLWKAQLTDKSAIEVRGGPSVRYNDALRLEKVRDQGSMMWEFKAKAPLVLGPLGVEYLGEALPAVTPVDRSQVNSDLALYLPVSGGKVKLGARHRWEDGNQEARSSSNFMQWYLGIEIGR